MRLERTPPRVPPPSIRTEKSSEDTELFFDDEVAMQQECSDPSHVPRQPTYTKTRDETSEKTVAFTNPEGGGPPLVR